MRARSLLAPETSASATWEFQGDSLSMVGLGMLSDLYVDAVLELGRSALTIVTSR
jgi:hypothetical protein